MKSTIFLYFGNQVNKLFLRLGPNRFQPSYTDSRLGTFGSN